MAAIGTLAKLKSAMKRWPSFTKRHHNHNAAVVSSADDVTAAASYPAADNLQAVYVGKCRRRYLLSSGIIHHPLFQELVDQSRLSENEDIINGNLINNREIVVYCEVVLFEHLLWMLNNSSYTDHDDDNQMGSIEDLVGFYIY